MRAQASRMADLPQLPGHMPNLWQVYQCLISGTLCRGGLGYTAAFCDPCPHCGCRAMRSYVLFKQLRLF
ncbi:hypothetical protein EMIT0P265_40008 [Pseudomonas zeae]